MTGNKSIAPKLKKYMDNRRQFLSGLASLAILPPRVFDRVPLRTAGVIALPAPFDHLSATLVEVTCAPGQASTAHKHPGFVLGYVLEGTFRFQMAGQPERILRPGDTFYEPPGGTHVVAESATAGRSARVLAIVIAETGKPIVEPA
ncbi:MAG TPA: cupin domain-containing protein [Gemmatimonadaceae bacterium]|nr:cupin domain-containing protein [Gemmatimonadaceae bacterium]